MPTQTEQAQQLADLIARREAINERRHANEAALDDAQQSRRAAYLADPAVNQAKADAALWTLRLNAEDLTAELETLDQQIRVGRARVGTRY